MVAEYSKVGESRFDGVLAAMIVGILALTVVSFFVFMIGTAGGWLSGALLLVVAYIPFFGLPLALIFMVVLVIRVARRRVRESREG